MKKDLNFTQIKSELLKLTDVDYLKKELQRLANEIKEYKLDVALTPQAKSKLKSLEKRFHDVRKALIKAEKQISTEVNKFVTLLRKTSAQTQAKMVAIRLGKKTSGKKATKKVAKKTTRKKSTRKAN